MSYSRSRGKAQDVKQFRESTNARTSTVLIKPVNEDERAEVGILRRLASLRGPCVLLRFPPRRQRRNDRSARRSELMMRRVALQYRIRNPWNMERTRNSRWLLRSHSSSPSPPSPVDSQHHRDTVTPRRGCKSYRLQPNRDLETRMNPGDI